MAENKIDKQTSTDEEMIFLPDFCGISMLFTMVVLAELMAFAILLATPQQQAFSWDRLGVLSLFIQWIALSSTGLLCVLRPWLVRLNDTLAGVVSYVAMLVVTLIVSECAFQLMVYTGTPYDNRIHIEFLLHTLGVSAILSGIGLRVIYLQYQQKIHIQANATARIQALQARIRPHFLFNSLNTIASLIHSRPKHAEEAVENLSELFRASIGQSSQLVSLAEEVQLARGYLEIEQLRLDDRLKVDWRLDELPDSALLPVLTLQPLLENAIFHGIEMLPEGGEIQVIGTRDGDNLCIKITNPCPTVRNTPRSQGNQMAMSNIDERLRIAFGGKAGLKMQRLERQCLLEIVFPFVEFDENTDN
jgi:two-component system sensor histidine kinase AlgZ